MIPRYKLIIQDSCNTDWELFFLEYLSIEETKQSCKDQINWPVFPSSSEHCVTCYVMKYEKLNHLVPTV